MTDFIAFSPFLILALLFFLQNKFFTTPEQLEKLHTEILKEMEKRYLPMISGNEIRKQITEIKIKIDKIYDFFIQN